MHPATYGCLILLLIVFQACSSTVPPAPPAPPAKDTRNFAAEIRARSQAFAAAEASGDIDATLAFWHPDGMLHNEGSAAVVGSAALRKVYEQFLPIVESLRTEMTRVEVDSEGDLAYEAGTRYQTLRFSSGPAQSTTKYLIVWKRGPRGKWLIAAASFTGNPGE